MHHMVLSRRRDGVFKGRSAILPSGEKRQNLFSPLGEGVADKQAGGGMDKLVWTFRP